MKQGTLGSISTGTLVDEELVKAMSNTLKELDEENMFSRLILEAELALDKPDTYADMEELIFDLEEALGEFAPPCCYFGGNECDPADLGFWINWGYIEELIAEKRLLQVSDLSEVPPDCQTDVLLVNDHGNPSYYTKKPWEGELVWTTV